MKKLKKLSCCFMSLSVLKLTAKFFVYILIILRIKSEIIMMYDVSIFEKIRLMHMCHFLYDNFLEYMNIFSEMP